MSFERAQQIADAVLLEGYVLYPYRADSSKNRYRWTFGVLPPRAWSDASGSEPWFAETECLIEGAQPLVRGRLRFLHVQRRQVEVANGEGFAPRERVDVLGETYLSWEEGQLEQVDFEWPLGLSEPLASFRFSFSSGQTIEPLLDGRGNVAGRIVRTRRALEGVVHVSAHRVDEARRPLWRLRARIENHSEYGPASAPRAEAMSAALVSTHLIWAATGADFVSLLDPPAYAARAAAGCRNRSLYPVLAGEVGRHDLLLCSPIILYDHPSIAPESPGDFFDATEIDELLALRTATLTADEKKLARATDARAAGVLERVEALTPAALARLHGRSRTGHEHDGSPLAEPATRASSTHAAAPRAYAPGARVRLRPGSRRTDAQDLLFAGCFATVEALLTDVDGRHCLAVTIDDDPAAELHRWYGRYRYYFLDEVEPVPADPA